MGSAQRLRGEGGPALPVAVGCRGGMHGGEGAEVVFGVETPRAKREK